jgi:hypothetical protein
MDKKELIKFLKQYNKWRVGEEPAPMPAPKDITAAINQAIGLIELLGQLEKNLLDLNPYPIDVFTEPSEQEWKRAWLLLHEAGISNERIAGKLGREVWNNCIEKLKQILDEPKQPKKES